MASLLRKGAIELKGKTDVIHETPLGTQLYDHVMHRKYLAWKEQMAEARAIKAKARG